VDISQISTFARARKIGKLFSEFRHRRVVRQVGVFRENTENVRNKEDNRGGDQRDTSVKPSRRKGDSLAAQRDQGKRQRIMGVSALVVLFVFGLKLWGSHTWTVEQVVLVALVASALTFCGLLWAFRFDVTRVGYMTVLPLPSLFVFGYVLFVELFFFQRFERIFEAVIFALILGVFWVILIIVFLTANVLNVATVKSLPLLQVAQTSSYMVSLFNIFFISFFIVNLGLQVPLTMALLFVVFWISIYLHISHFGIGTAVILYTTGIACSVSVVSWALLLWPVEMLMRVLLPTVVAYIGMGIVLHDVRKAMRPLLNWEYLLMVLFVLVILASRAVWGIGGNLWS